MYDVSEMLALSSETEFNYYNDEVWKFQLLSELQNIAQLFI